MNKKEKLINFIQGLDEVKASLTENFLPLWDEQESLVVVLKANTYFLTTL